MRQHAICDKVTRCNNIFIFKNKLKFIFFLGFKETENSDKSFFSEVTKSIR